jgi:hypothetical protein
MDSYLHVRLGVKRKLRDDFIAQAEEFLATGFLQKRGWQFLLGFELLSSRLIDDLTRAPTQLPENLTYFTNVWKLPPKFDVASIMLELSELSAYVTTETQEIVLRINDPSQSDDDLAKELRRGGVFAMVRHYPFRSDLASFVFSSAALAPTLESLAKFVYAGCYQSVTGLLNEFWDIWKVGETTREMAAAETQDALLQTRGRLEDVIARLQGEIADDYRKAIYFDRSSLSVDELQSDYRRPPDGPDDGIVLVKAASYWARETQS